MRVTRCAVGLALVLLGCEDGPKQIFTPNQGDPAAQNGTRPSGSWTQGGSKDFDDSAGKGDSNQRARFCDERENEEVLKKMVEQPIKPDVSLGGVPLWSKSGQPVHANDLIGRPEDGKFCDPTVWADALTWGPTYEIIAFINQETKLVEQVLATQQYQGSFTAKFNDPASNNAEVAVTIRPNHQIQLGDRKLTEWASSANQATKPNAWLNHKNINDLYRAIRQTYFGATNLPANLDCVATQICDIIYTSSDQTQPKTTALVFQDSGVTLQFTPEGHIQYFIVEPVRVAPFEVSAQLQLVNGLAVAPAMTSQTKPGCSVALDGTGTWSQFTQKCVDDTHTLSRATYETSSQRDGLSAAFNGVTLHLMRPVAKGEVVKDGERPKGTETLFGLQFTRTLNAPVAEFVPAVLAVGFKGRLEARLRGLVASDPGHPFYNFTLTLPAGLPSTPQRIGELTYTEGGTKVSWLPKVISDVQAQYRALTPAQQRPVAQVLNNVYLIEPFVDAVLDAFTGNAAAAPGAFKGFRSTNDRRWAIGRASFMQGGVPFRLEVQYSLNYGAVTAVSVERGSNQLDAAYAKANQEFRPSTSPSAYYGLDVAVKTGLGNPFALGASDIEVLAVDRAQKTLDVKLTGVDSSNRWTRMELTVPGTHLDDFGGYRRQIRGERWEFVPAHEVTLLGKETWLTFWVEADGKIGRISQGTFKHPTRLCKGPTTSDDLLISYGDDVRGKLDAWSKRFPLEYRVCEIVFNYSENGNILDSVTSISNKTLFSTIDGRALGVAAWR